MVDVGTVLFPLGLGHQIAGGQILGIGLAHLERHLYDPKLGIPAAVGFHQGKVPTYLDIPPNITWQAVEKPDLQHPLGIKGRGRAVTGFGLVLHCVGNRRCAGRTSVQPHAGFRGHDPQSPVGAPAGA